MNTKQKLLSSARHLLLEVGYESMSPAMVLAHSGAGQGSLYHHFSGKQDLAIKALEEVRTELERGFLEIFDDETLQPLEKLQCFLERRRNGLLGCKLGRLSNEKALTQGDLHEPLLKYFSFVVQRVETTLAQAIGQGALPGDTPVREISHLIVAAVQGGYVISKATSDTDAVNNATRGALAVLENLARQAGKC